MGAFGLKPHRAAEITDGLSNTVAMCERRLGSWSTSFDRRRDYWFTGISADWPRDEILHMCGSLKSSTPECNTQVGQLWIRALLGSTYHNHVAPPNWNGADCVMTSWKPDMPEGGPGTFTARSWHSGGVNVVFLDGAVHWVKDSIDLAVWRAMATRADGDQPER